MRVKSPGGLAAGEPSDGEFGVGKAGDGVVCGAGAAVGCAVAAASDTAVDEDVPDGRMSEASKSSSSFFNDEEDTAPKIPVALDGVALADSVGPAVAG